MKLIPAEKIYVKGVGYDSNDVKGVKIMLDTIYNFLFTPIMSHNFMDLFYGVKPISIFVTFFIVCFITILSIIILNKLDNKLDNNGYANNNYWNDDIYEQLEKESEDAGIGWYDPWSPSYNPFHK